MPERNTVTWNTMIAGYSKSGQVETALQVFDRMPLRDLASWSTMIAGHVNNGHWGCGLLLFRDMNALEELKPDQVTLGSILAGCAHMDSIGLQIMACTAIKW
ncbi:pentatricopeptide repeat-containing protein At1g14470-like [Actinidia eriantha]|uniref:pentatricopeptide repeat-containing protein At1g14470-like n=1 Tax=Actinidia eriantha TaxID=165200 RepID=UPI0025828489|nr:pentatricopeptide repeat-containing protein At1g14470-like [Actinidia eriantha]